ncbi:hypothetical protein [Dactylosporangium sp. NPDC051484]
MLGLIMVGAAALRPRGRRDAGTTATERERLVAGLTDRPKSPADE